VQEITLFVQEATEEQPIKTLENILVNLDGIERALVDIEDGEVKIVYHEEKVTPDWIKYKIKQYGMHLQ
jgi:copper chaperone CopZ